MSAKSLYMPKSVCYFDFCYLNNIGTGSDLQKERFYPCLCLHRLFTQITRRTPLLFMILHFSQIFFTDDLTFIIYLKFLKLFVLK